MCLTALRMRTRGQIARVGTGECGNLLLRLPKCHGIPTSRAHARDLTPHVRRLLNRRLILSSYHGAVPRSVMALCFVVIDLCTGCAIINTSVQDQPVNLSGACAPQLPPLRHTPAQQNDTQSFSLASRILSSSASHHFNPWSQLFAQATG